MKPSTYRFEYDSVYKYNEEAYAYIFIGKLNGRSKAQFLRDWESRNDTY
jgi:hypothetical protein